MVVMKCYCVDGVGIMIGGLSLYILYACNEAIKKFAYNLAEQVFACHQIPHKFISKKWSYSLGGKDGWLRLEQSIAGVCLLVPCI